MLLGDLAVAKVCTSPRNSTLFTRLFLLVRGEETKHIVTSDITNS